MFDMNNPDPGLLFILDGGSVSEEFGIFFLVMNLAVILGGGFWLMFCRDDD